MSRSSSNDIGAWRTMGARRLRAAAAAAVVAGLGAAAVPALAGDVRFTDVTAASGVDYVQWRTPPVSPQLPLLDIPMFTGGAAAGDYDRDGWTDLLVTRYDDTPILYRNAPNAATGGRRFVDVTPAALKPTESGAPVRTNGAAWGDVNNDGHLDVFVTTSSHARHLLFMGDGTGNFVEDAAARGVAHDYGAQRYGISPSFGDYDRDGHIDLLTTEWSHDVSGPRGTRLHRNLGAARPGHFVDVTEAAKVVRPGMVKPHSFTARFADLDRDGHQDIAITSDHGTNQLFWNNKDGTFADGTVVAGINTSESQMGSTIGDYNGDGRPDWFVSAITRTGGNRLYRNLGNREFAEVSGSGAPGSALRDGGWGWGSAFIDYDNDGRLDLVQTNGQAFYDAEYQVDQTRAYHNEGGGRFVEVATSLGISDTGMGKGLLTLDYDNDGDLDVFIVNNASSPILYRNDGGNANHWLKVRPVGGAGSGVAGAVTNRDGFGVLVTITDAALPTPLTIEIDGGNNYLGQSDPTAFFGLGPNFTGLDTVDRLDVQWPGGVLQSFFNVAPDQVLVPMEVNAVPEPGTGAVLAGLAAVVLGRRRRGRAGR